MRNSHLVLSILLLSVTTWLGVSLWFVDKKATVQQPLKYEPEDGVSTVSTLADSNRISRLLIAQDSVWQITHYEDVPLLQELLRQSQSIAYEKGIFISARRLGRHAQENDSNTQAMEWFRKGEPYVHHPVNIASSAHFYMSMSVSLRELDKLTESMKYLQLALSATIYSTKNHQKIDSNNIYNNFGILFSRLGERSYSLMAFRQAHDLSLLMADTPKLCTSLGNIGNVYMMNLNVDSAEIYFKQELALSRKINHKRGIIQSLVCLAQIADHEGKYLAATSYLKDLFIDSLASGMSPPAILMTRGLQGTLYQHLGRYSEATSVLKLALTEARAIHSGSDVESLERKLARVYEESGQYAKAYDHMYRYADIRDSLFLKEKASALDAWSRSKIAEKDKAMYAQQLFITKQKGELQRKNLVIGGSLSLAVMLALIIAVTTKNYRNRQSMQRAHIAQLGQQQEINMLKSRIQGEEEERTRIGRELHDNIASQLWAVKLNVDSIQQDVIEDSRQQEELRLVFRQLHDIGNDVRKTAHNLMPDLLLEEGLATALASICERTKMNTGLEVDFLEYGIIPNMDKEIELSLYRMVQELIQNVLKHARDATYLLVQLSCTDMLLSITVEDNGFGFSRQKEGMGLQQIRNKVAIFKGSFELQSVPGKGTTAYLEFDLRHFL